MNDFTIINGVLTKYSGSATRVIIPDTVTSIEDWTFMGQNTPEEIVIPESVTYIGNCAFDNCSKITDITISKNNPAYKSVDGAVYTKSGETLMFYPNARGDEIINVPYGVKIIGESAFSRNRTLTEAIIPESVRRIGRMAFCRCPSLARVNIPNGVESIGLSAFAYCGSLTELILPDSVKTVEFKAFEGCGSLRLLVIPDNVRSIMPSAFHGIPNTGRIYIKKEFMTQLETIENEGAWAAAIRGFLTRYYSQKIEEVERREWKCYIGQRNTKALRLLRDEPLLYRYFTEKNTFSLKRAETLLDKTENTECRAILLEYINKRKKRKKSADGVIDSLFSLDD